MAAAPIKTSNYDVLIETVGEDDKFQLSDCRQAVGNKRFQVLLSMHHADYASAERQDDVISKLVDIVCRQCVPNGRFLLLGKTRAGGIQWEELDEERVKQFIRDELAALSSQSNGDHPVPAQEPTDFRKSAPDRKKRRPSGRPSLLRRAVSEGGATRSTGSFWKRIRPRRASIVKQPQPLDIIFSEQRDSLLTHLQEDQQQDLLGNNRIRVLLDVQRQNYQTCASFEEQNSIVADLIHTVTVHWNGRFLAKQPEGSRVGGYIVLDNEQATRALQLIMGSSPSAAPSADNRRPSTVKHESLQALHQVVPPLSAAATGRDLDDIRSDAVASLQKRNQRKGLFNRMTDYSSQTGSVNGSSKLHSAPPKTHLDRSVSEPTKPSHPPEHRMSEFSNGAMDTFLEGLDLSELSMEPPISEGGLDFGDQVVQQEQI